MSVTNLATVQEFDEFIKSRDLLVIHFYAPWADQCGQMNELLEDLAKSHKNGEVQFAKVEAEDLSEVSLKYKITAVPTVILVKNLAQIDRVDGANPSALVDKIKAHLPKGPLVYVTKPEVSLEERLKKLINQAPCMLFMKGNPQNPFCGFSRTIVGLLDSLNADYQSFDILQDQTVREGLKKFSNWPTYPQLYVNGELLGGLDLVKEALESGELEGMLPKKS
ncbi:glutaredoxin 3 isoform X2 [Fopius arisanus]|uniref:Glutaredoxin 3 isoform X2 n=1 Tax=Fopius arisanus TaxID=64838 RepID=A0A9R1TUR4_9HYME|nr:PREDICTED: glutaredoxin 3 isoform X2 [Fopius arisanus]